MKTVFTYLLLILIIFFSSCSKVTKEETLGYGSNIPLSYDFDPPSIDQRRHLRSHTIGTINVYNSITDYTFILDSDIKQFYQAGIDLRMKVLNNFYSDIAAGNFYNSDFSKHYRPLLAPNVRAEILKYAKAANPRNDIYAWQPFTPLPIVSKIYVRYQITYEGDDWFSITPEGDDTSVRLKVVLAGKAMNPVITEIKNPAFDVNISRAGSKSLGKGYTLKQEWSYGVFNNKSYTRTFWYYIANIVYNACSAGKADKSYISEADLLAFADRTERKQAQFLQNFCADLSSANYTAPTFVQKYSDNLTTAIAGALIDADKSVAAGETLLSGLQVVLYGKELRPLVVGLSNQALGIDIHKDFIGHRDNMSYGIHLYKHR